MIKKIIPQIKKIFVGRHSELEQLEGLWEFSCEDVEHPVYVFLNTPGVGKTTLIDHFGKFIEAEGKGLFIKFICRSDYSSPIRLNKNIIKIINQKIQTNKKIIDEYISQNTTTDGKDWAKRSLEQFQAFINELLNKSKPDISDISDAFIDLSRIIPIFFAIDEIQELQKLTFENKDNDDPETETGLHYFSRILKNLLNSRILLVLSGTRYHILSQIGGDLGSPIRQKVKPLIIQKFEKKEVLAYVKELKKLVESKEKSEDINYQLENYQQFLFAFSGGHPRTIESITEHFLNYLQHLLSDSKYLDYSVFVGFFLPKLKEFFSNSLFSTVHKEALLNLAVSESFSIIKGWLLNRASQGQFLGERPQCSENPQMDEEIKRIVYELMNIGIIVQNGNYNYHITSYFHFLEFLNLYNEPYDLFLREVLHNKYFKLMCGFHSGFGYTFENVFAAALLIRGSKNQQESKIPIQIKQLKSLKVLKGKTKWSEVQIESNILYQTPMAETIDGYLLQDNNLLLMQITTANPPDSLKIESLLAEIKAFSELKLEVVKDMKVRGWFISLFKLKKELPSYKNLLITAGNQLVPFIGEELYIRLKAVKEAFSK